MKKRIDITKVPELFFQYFDKTRFTVVTKLIILLGLFFLVGQEVTNVFARYEATATSSADAMVAFYIIDAKTQKGSVSLGEIIPREEPYIYTFLVSNHDDTKRTEVTLDYKVSFITTTNLPLTYELYKNENYTDPGATNLITSEEVVMDQDGTYFKKIVMDETNRFHHAENETNVYNLVVRFPPEYQNGHDQYQGVIEGITVKINATQVIQPTT